MKRRSHLKDSLPPKTALIENLSHDGKGIARIDGKATFIQGALPNELVEFQYTRVKKDFDEGVVLRVIEASDLRVAPKCAHYTVCGGCSLQHLQEDKQIQFKHNHLLDLLQRFGRTIPLQVLPSLRTSAWNYRNKARLSVRYVEKKETVMVGFRERNSPRFIAEINHCRVLHSKVDNDIEALRHLITSFDDKRSIAQIEVAAGDEDVALIFRNLSPLSEKDAQKLKEFAVSHQYSIFLQPQGPDSVFCFYSPNATPYLSYSLPQYQITFSFHPNDFTQVNSGLNQLMVQRAIELMELQPSDRVLDLFCGLGNFSLPFARFCAHVVGIEGSKTMVERAYRNATLNNISNVDFYAANLDDAEEVKSIMRQSSFNKLLLDPPRSGALEVIKNIELFNPERIVYVSCNPTTLARDTEVLVHQKNYKLIAAGVMDMFPHTAHVESIALFEKG